MTPEDLQKIINTAIENEFEYYWLYWLIIIATSIIVSIIATLITSYLKEKANRQPDTALLLITVFKTLQSYQNLVAWSSARVNDSQEGTSEIIRLKQQTLKALADNFLKGDLVALETDLAMCNQTENKTGFSNIM